MTFQLNPRQDLANKMLGSSATHTLLYGGSRSGKTFLICRAIAIRAMRVEKSRHAIFRYRFNSVKTAVWYDTFPKMMSLCFPGATYTPNKSDYFYTFPNGSEVWIGGLDDKDRVDKVLGQEHATIFLNECSQISFSARETVRTRLAQNVGLPLRMYYDENPPRRTHWSYRLFVAKVHPEPPNRPIPDPENYQIMQMNPVDNQENLSPTYIAELQTLSARQRLRFLDGEFGQAGEGQLFDQGNIETNRVKSMPALQRIVVAVDPSGSKGEEGSGNKSDDIGIVVAGLGLDGHCYVLEDATINAGPGTWGKVVVNAYQRFEADAVVGESNYGGAMVEHVVKTAATAADVSLSYKEVRASRGKIVRAEPAAAMYEQNRVHHVGMFSELEDQLSDMTTGGYIGDGSPDRADALVWAMAELFPALVRRMERPGVSPIIEIDSPLDGF